MMMRGVSVAIFVAASLLASQASAQGGFFGAGNNNNNRGERNNNMNWQSILMNPNQLADMAQNWLVNSMMDWMDTDSDSSNETVPDAASCRDHSVTLDDVCVGRLFDTKMRFFFNTTSQMCEPFFGCKPQNPGNNFATLQSCGSVCNVTVSMAQLKEMLKNMSASSVKTTLSNFGGKGPNNGGGKGNSQVFNSNFNVMSGDWQNMPSFGFFNPPMNGRGMQQQGGGRPMPPPGGQFAAPGNWPPNWDRN